MIAACLGIAGLLVLVFVLSICKAAGDADRRAGRE